MQNTTNVQKSKAVWGWIALSSGIGASWLLLNTLIGVASGFIHAFATLRASGGADPAELASDISVAILTGLWSFIFSLIFLIPCLIAFVNYRRLGRLLVATCDLKNKKPDPLTNAPPPQTFSRK